MSRADYCGSTSELLGSLLSICSEDIRHQKSWRGIVSFNGLILIVMTVMQKLLSVGTFLVRRQLKEQQNMEIMSHDN